MNQPTFRGRAMARSSGSAISLMCCLAVLLVVAVSQPVAGQGGAPGDLTTYTTTYTYDQGRLVHAIYDEAFTFEYTYDAAGNLVEHKAFEGTPSATESEAELPERFALHPNYPNPFNPTTKIRYDLPRAVSVRLIVYDVLGRRVTTLVRGEQAAGFHTVAWDGRSDAGVAVASGVYLYRLEAGTFTRVRTMLLVK